MASLPNAECGDCIEATHTDYAKSILLPFDQVFRNLRNAKRFAIDIGGSLAKLAYCSTVAKKTALITAAADNGRNSGSSASYGVSETNVEGMRLHFIKFETKYMESCLNFIREKMLEAAATDDSCPSSPTSPTSRNAVSKVIKATGGGAHKYFDLIAEKLQLRVDKEDEMECLIKGCNFLLRNIPDESFTYHHHEPIRYKFQNVDPNIFPYLLINIGSGVSMVKVDSDGAFERVGGTSLGGGTFWGLGSLLTQAKNFDDLLLLAEQGDHRNVDMLVSDIYGGAYEKLGLPGDLIASSFGKTVRSRKDSQSEFEQRDVARSLLLTISNCIGQIAYLYAKVHNLKRIYFGGYFIRGHPFTMRTISYAINYWSGGEVQALFLRHEGYLGAVGAFLKGAEEDSKQLADIDMASLWSWSEHYAGSTGYAPIPSAFLSKSQSVSALIQLLEMDCAQKNLVSCPLLWKPSEYNPDTVDLTQDDEARQYWLECFENGIEKTVKKALESQPQSSDVVERAANFKHRYIHHLRLLKQHPFAYGCLNVRSLLDLNEQLLNEYYFFDAYLQQKQNENDSALKMFKDHATYLDSLDFDARHLELVRALLAGNVFDWGAKEIVKLLEAGDGLSFSDALNKIQPRPWHCDDFDEWMERLKSGNSHKCACIFVDNSGFDLVLGIIPFARELLRQGTKVILCANSRPALNDVTFNELAIVLDQVAKMCPIIDESLKEGVLRVAENGQGSPCLDLRIDGTLAQMMITMNVDLLVLEGMGRAIHTNFTAPFTCETLKIAALKNQWLANRLGGVIFDVIFKYEKARKTKFALSQSSDSSSATLSED